MRCHIVKNTLLHTAFSSINSKALYCIASAEVENAFSSKIRYFYLDTKQVVSTSPLPAYSGAITVITETNFNFFIHLGTMFWLEESPLYMIVHQFPLTSIYQLLDVLISWTLNIRRSETQ